METSPPTAPPGQAVPNDAIPDDTVPDDALVDDTVDGLRQWARRRLKAAGDDGFEPREATSIVGLALGWSDAQVLARGDRLPSPAERRTIRRLVERRVLGEPFAYLAGRREFYGRQFLVDPRVLIPRPETEHLIEACLDLDPAPRRIVDIGTGSGCIALTLALELPGTSVWACDASLSALAVAHCNLQRLSAEDDRLPRRVHLFASDLLTAVAPNQSRIDTLVSNPPYIARGEQLPKTVVDYEPDIALFAGADGTDAYRRILTSAPAQRPGVRALFEIGANQGPGVRSIASTARYQVLDCRPDLAGWERVLVLQRRVD